MPFSNTIKRYLLIRDDEWSLVIRLFTFEFFQGASIALLFTSALSLFLHYYHAADLPEVFILAAFLMWLTGIVYNQLEHRLNERQLTLAALLVNAASILGIRLIFYSAPAGWFYFLTLAWFNVAYLLNNLEFWGLASILFDVRQSKRLFGVVSAGDIPAKLIGYLAATSFIATAPDALQQTQNLLWVALFFSMISLFLFWRLHLSGLLEIHIIPQGKRIHSSHQSLFQKIKNHNLIFNVAAVSLLSLCCYLVSNFVLYGYVEQAVHDSASLAIFIALFMGTSRLITLILKLIFTSRLLSQFGFRNALLVTPVATFLVCAALLVFSHTELSMLLWFGAIAIVLDALRSSIQSPVLLTTMQPLPVHDRMSGHTIMKGLTDPIAYLFIGVLLFTLTRLNEINYTLFTSLIMSLIIVWIWFALKIEKDFLQTLVAAIRDRFISGEEIPFTDQETLNVLRNKLSSPDELDAAFVLQLIRDQSFDEKAKMIETALKHPKPMVRAEALSLLNELPDAQAKKIAYELLGEEKDPAVLAILISRGEPVWSEEDLQPYLNSNDRGISNAALIALCKKNPEKWNTYAEKLIKQVSTVDQAAENRIAIDIIRETRNRDWFPVLIRLAKCSEKNIATRAIEALGIQHDRECAEALCDLLLAGKYTSNVKSALVETGNIILPLLIEMMHTFQPSRLKKNIISIVGKLNTADAADLLMTWCNEFPLYHLEIFQALKENQFHREKEHLKPWIDYYLKDASRILFMIEWSFLADQQTLYEALQHDLMQTRKKLLLLFSFFCDQKRIAKAQAGFELATRESISNALEIIENAVELNDARFFNTIFDQAPVSYRCQTLSRNFALHSLDEHEMKRQLLMDDTAISSWSKACFLYTYRPRPDEDLFPLIRNLAAAEDDLLRETAEFALNFSFAEK